jgi:diadenylate cyclase
MKDERTKENEMLNVLKMVSPGTVFREGLDNILRAKTGALIVIGDSDEVLGLVDGGFSIHSDYSPAYIYELAKMDGAIIMSKDLKKLLYANAQLVPNHTIPTSETGTRHRTAERVSRQTDEVVISISQRRNVITIYKGSKKHVLRDVSVVIDRASQALQALEKYKVVLDSTVNNLSVLEFEDVVTLYDVGSVMQRIEMVIRIVDEIEGYIVELGKEGRLVQMQLDELKVGVLEDEIFVLEDYISEYAGSEVDEVKMQLRNLSKDHLMDLVSICRVLGYQCNSSSLDGGVSPRGYRILNKVPRLPGTVVRNMVNRFNGFQGILGASLETLDDVEGIGEVRAKAIRDGIKKIHEQIIWENLRK